VTATDVVVAVAAAVVSTVRYSKSFELFLQILDKKQVVVFWCYYISFQVAVLVLYWVALIIDNGSKP